MLCREQNAIEKRGCAAPIIEVRSENQIVVKEAQTVPVAAVGEKTFSVDYVFPISAPVSEAEMHTLVASVCDEVLKGFNVTVLG